MIRTSSLRGVVFGAGAILILASVAFAAGDRDDAADLTASPDGVVLMDEDDAAAETASPSPDDDTDDDAAETASPSPDDDDEDDDEDEDE